MSQEIANALIRMAEEGEKFIAQGITNNDGSNPEVQSWVFGCMNYIQAVLDKSRDNRAKNFRNAQFNVKPKILRGYAADFSGKELGSKLPLVNIHLSQTQTTSVTNQIFLQLLLNIGLQIDNSDLSPDHKEEAKKLVDDIQHEVQKLDTNWDKVTGWLKKSLDYGLKIAPDIINLAAAYFNAKG